MTPMMRMMAACAALVAGQAHAVTFQDSTFDLASYDRQVFQSGSAALVSVDQTLRGNPGAALTVTVNYPTLAANSAVSAYLFNRSFTYDPAATGAIGSVAFDLDLRSTLTGSPFISHNASVVVIQAGSLYAASTNFIADDGSFDHFSLRSLNAASFNLIPEPSRSGTVDIHQHPDFSAGPLVFGTVVTFASSISGTGVQRIVDLDNLGITITPVPEPSQAAMTLAGLLGMALVLRRRRFGPP